jgi:hypothetical protein
MGTYCFTSDLSFSQIILDAPTHFHCSVLPSMVCK